RWRRAGRAARRYAFGRGPRRECNVRRPGRWHYAGLRATIVLTPASHWIDRMNRRTRPPIASATAIMVTAALLFGVMAILAKAAAARLPGPEVAFVRFVIGLLACVVAATRLRLRANNWRGLFWRGAFGGAAVLCYFLAIAHLPVGMATLLNYTAPVFTA